MFYTATPLTDTTSAPYKRTVGMEIELASGRESAKWFFDNGHSPSARLHGYHCSCEQRNDFPIHPTEDGTAPGGEYILGGAQGMLFGSPRFYKATEIAEEGFISGRAKCSTNVGMHVHVGMHGLEENDKKLLLRNYLAHQESFVELASGNFKECRNNGCTTARLMIDRYIPSERYSGNGDGWKTFWSRSMDDWSVQFPGRPTFNMHGCNRTTTEFRLWNSTRTQWRMILAAGLSSAFVEAAAEGRIAAKPDKDTMINAEPIESFLDGLLTTDMLGLILRQRKFWKSRNS